MQIGLSMADLELLTVGMVNDLFTEMSNDRAEDDGTRPATQEDFDNF